MALKETLLKIGAKVVSHGRNLAFQMAEVGDFTAFIITRRHPGVAGLGAAAATSGRIDVKRSIVVPSLQRRGASGRQRNSHFRCSAR
jgi:hypothetical protein